MNSLFVQRLLIAAPELRAVYDTHVRKNDELLPYVFMGDVTRVAIEHCANKDDQFPARLLDFFESELTTGNGEASNLIALGFCENLIGERGVQNDLACKMGPLLFEMMKTYAR